MIKKNKAIFLLILTFALVFSFLGCSGTTDLSDSSEDNVKNNTSFPITITDSYNRTVTLGSEPQKIISIAPNITEIIFSLGESDKLIGRSEYCDYPEDVKNIPSVGSLTDPNLEKIVELKPDLVIVSPIVPEEIIAKLDELGLKVVSFHGKENFDGTYEIIENVARVLNDNESAEKLISEMKAKVQSVVDKVKDEPKVSTYYALSFGKSGDYTAGSDTFIGEMIELAGGNNIADDISGWAYSLEKLVEKNPDIIICSKYSDSKQGIENSNGYKDLDAIKNGKLYEIDNNLLDRQGPRVADGLVEIAKIIHPEVFK
ncbi:putative iron (III) dicitrate transport substrate binding protein [Gottschalkia acidurici 9a]|uniref:Iron (III) dicitrate transport substrate binding protein n=1 Tax=Gottschalkia acidurici (strain ATCC 7906 / DSM 604 / BCRC 14475 / CIP 104303 / KCTC 5404 / NCIMB 10678 / 9a) TaxID=1128398 RepID=K0B3L9_GOTA9|nr:ABC transporter substrate-binding protein [Gottschalkia acidurici]AFS79455.1 putative iron (III) dicitrate transport substrate binding protein [Gottschalkia acidurici 9a]